MAFKLSLEAEVLAIPATLSKAAHSGEMEIVSLRPHGYLEAPVTFRPSPTPKLPGSVMF